MTIAASRLNKVTLGLITAGNNGTPFGVAGDSIGSVSASVGENRLSLKKLETQQDVTDQIGSTPLGDFRVNVV